MDIELIFHQAAFPSVPVSVEDPVEDPVATHETNITGTLNLLRSAVTQQCRRLMYAASSSAYGDTDVSPVHEGIVPCPLSPYAVQKLAGEHYCRAFWECYGLETISLRYFNVFGPRQDPKSQYAAAIPAFVTALLADEPPTVYGDGEQTRDFTYIDNVVHGNLARRQDGQVRRAGGQPGLRRADQRQPDHRQAQRAAGQERPAHLCRSEARRREALLCGHPPGPGAARLRAAGQLRRRAGPGDRLLQVAVGVDPATAAPAAT